MSKKENSRRQFLQNAVALSGGVAAAGLAGNALAAQPASAGAAQAAAKTADVVIAGAGLAGLCAAVSAVQSGARVILLEASRETGGTGLLAAGNIHSQGALDWPAMLKNMPFADPVLGKVFMANYVDTINWLRETGAFSLSQAGARQGAPAGAGAPGAAPAAGAARGAAAGPAGAPGGAPGGGAGGGPGYGISLNLGSGYTGKRATCDHLNGIILKSGEILYKTKFCDLIANAAGRVTGIKAVQENGAPLTVNARKAVILATGGFGCNKEMVAKYLGTYADLSVQRTVPYNDGTGLLAAVRLGAMLSRSMTGFYGHMQPFPALLPQTPEEYEAFDRDLFRSIGGSMQSFTTRAVIVNQDGLRFVDETIGDEEVIQVVLRQKHAVCWVILDSKATNANAMKSLEGNKAVVLTGNTIEELAGKMAEYGVSAPHVIQTMNEYNKAVQEKSAAKLTPPRGGTPAEMAVAPFFAIQATGGISATYGGLAINEKCQVLGGARVPIPGLYAAPHTAGGIFYETYGGSLGSCATFGRLAGKFAAAESVA